MIVGEQCRTPALVEFCHASSVVHCSLPYDCGVSTARNCLVRRVDTNFIVLADDDYLFTEAPEFGTAVRFLHANPHFVCLCGDVVEFNGKDGNLRPVSQARASMLAIDSTGKGIIKIPLELIRPETVLFEDETILVCDMAPQWGVFRTSLFLELGMLWDERFKTGGEHMDFFLRIKTDLPSRKVGFWPRLRCEHRRERSGAYAELRMRTEWMKLFAEKHGLQYYLPVGSYPRFLCDPPKPDDARR